ncbi:MAG: hypothetical protein PEGG_00902 [Paraeggerthella hongkongensis]|uniref:cytochrome c3 family protein n=1 Tax=Paraeggerthella TaxID=651554 RepID=UPI001C11A756|nr:MULTISPECIES: cytochrome c3 family protein [Paraeggerthella]MBU5404880.1 cytochrome c3 family protein [Paraeggerthella hongkongensis]MCD2433132.1 cytochrome c3 family protein [Paraeggerthella hominis]MDY3980814.1 cytochrome c3 family protein [Paraeggerthella sp.]
MLNANRSARVKTVVFAAALCFSLGLAACAPSGTQESSSSVATTQTSGDVAGAYVSDEQCLSCHGGSYEALAETTSSYGASNPHDSIHGGYNSCVNCHAKDKEVTDNQCLHCHDWPHNPKTA